MTSANYVDNRALMTNIVSGRAQAQETNLKESQQPENKERRKKEESGRHPTTHTRQGVSGAGAFSQSAGQHLRSQATINSIEPTTTPMKDPTATTTTTTKEQDHKTTKNPGKAVGTLATDREATTQLMYEDEDVAGQLRS